MFSYKLKPWHFTPLSALAIASFTMSLSLFYRCCGSRWESVCGWRMEWPKPLQLWGVWPHYKWMVRDCFPEHRCAFQDSRSSRPWKLLGGIDINVFYVWFIHWIFLYHASWIWYHCLVMLFHCLCVVPYHFFFFLLCVIWLYLIQFFFLRFNVYLLHAKCWLYVSSAS